VFAIYRGQFGEDPTVPAPPQAGGDPAGGTEEPKDVAARAALKRLVEQGKVSDETMRSLAQRRAAHIKDHFVLRGGIEDSRLYLQDANLSAPSDGTRVRLELALDAR